MEVEEEEDDDDFSFFRPRKSSSMATLDILQQKRKRLVRETERDGMGRHEPRVMQYNYKNEKDERISLDREREGP